MNWYAILWILLPYSLFSYETYDVVIIGSGPAGLTAGIYSVRSNLKTAIIEGDNPGGQLTSSYMVDNWPGIPSISGLDLMNNMRAHAEILGCHVYNETVVSVSVDERPFIVITDCNTEIRAQALIVATGAQCRKLDCPGFDKYWGKGVSACPICDGFFMKDKPIVIVGGGNAALEHVKYLHKFTDYITIVQNLPYLTVALSYVKTLRDEKVLYNCIVKEIRGNGYCVTEIVILNTNTGEEFIIPAEGVFIAIGMCPCTELFKDTLVLDATGAIVVHDGVCSSIEGVFVAGDVASGRYKQAIIAAGRGCLAALCAEEYLNRENT